MENNSKKKVKGEGISGITLISLVITVIVLLLLAGVSITMLKGNNNLITQAEKAKEETEKASIEEQRQLAQMEANMNTDETEYLGVKVPAGYAPTKIEGENSLEDGLVIIDGAGNEYVWIEVPNDGSGPDYKEVKDSTDYTNIENALHTYTNTYRNGTLYKDNYNELDDAKVKEATGLTKQQYKELKEKMLKSIYENGGFYIGRYETGMQSEEEYLYNYINQDASKMPVIKANAYPYNYVTCKQAQQLTEEFRPSEEKYTTSLMFGVQWDLVLRYLESKGVTQRELNEESTNWGNYKNNTLYTIKAEAKGSDTAGENWNLQGGYSKDEEKGILLTTGASDKFSKQNIYDIAGNIREWTLEYTNNIGYPCINRGGDYIYAGASGSASYRRTSDTKNYNSGTGFRISLY